MRAIICLKIASIQFIIVSFNIKQMSREKKLNGPHLTKNFKSI